VTLKVYDETLRVLKRAVERAKLGSKETLEAIRRLDAQARLLEARASGPSFDAHIATERAQSAAGRSVRD
jgi:hypothetical protein